MPKKPPSCVITCKRGEQLQIDSDVAATLDGCKFAMITHHQNGFRSPVFYRPGSRSYTSLQRFLFPEKNWNHGHFRVSFRDGDNLNWRRENLEVHAVQSQVSARSSDGALHVNGCTLQRAAKGARCFPEREICGHYPGCLDAVIEMGWSGWTAVRSK